MPSNYQEEARKILELFLKRLFLREKKEFLLLASKWGVVADELDSQIIKLASQENLSEDKLYRLALYKTFREQAENQIKQYSIIAGKIIADEQKIFGEAGLKSSQEMIGLKVKFFQKLNADVINNFIGKSFYDGSKLDSTLFARSFKDYMDKVKDELLKGVALGRNPREVARQIKKVSNAPLWQSLRLARTEQLNIFRQTSTMQMEKSGVVDGWERIESMDSSTCDYCQSENGKVYKFGEEPSWHVNCRGAKVPYFKE